MKKIRLTQGKFALVDDEDFDFLSQWKWCVDSKGYAKRTVCLGKIDGKKKYRTLLMHRVLLNPGPDQEVDHRNRIRSDNRRINLRLCTQNQNHFNCEVPKKSGTSKYRGVIWCKRDKRWIAQLRFNRKHVLRKAFPTEVEAALAYNEAAKMYHGEFALLNEINTANCN